MADNFEVKIENLDKLQRAMRDYPQTAQPILQKALEGTQFVFQKHTLKGDPVPWRTGNLLQSFRFGSSPLQARWFPTARYAPFVEFGTAPHLIKPKRARVLSWQTGGGGRYVTSRTGRQYYQSSKGERSFSMVVHHPGTKPKPFMEKIAARSTGDIAKLFEQAGDIITREIARQSN